MSAPASAVPVVAALARGELRLAARRGESLLVTLVIPPAVLVFFAGSGIVPAPSGRPVDFLLPGSIALAVIASGLVSLGIATAYERSYGVLKRLGGAPIGRSAVIAAKILAVLAVQAFQLALLLAVAWLVLGWRPAVGLTPGIIVVALLLGTLAFAGLGLLMAGTLRAEATLAGANGLFLLFLMLGGIVLPVDHLAAPLDALAGVLPAAALSEALRAGFGTGGDPIGPLALLAAWGAAAGPLAARSFRPE